PRRRRSTGLPASGPKAALPAVRWVGCDDPDVHAGVWAARGGRNLAHPRRRMRPRRPRAERLRLHARAATEHTVAVAERDFHITAPAVLRSGTVTLRIHNQGPDQHELIVVPGTLASLPLRADGMTVDEEAVEASEPGSLEPGEPGSTRDLTIQLKPGHYVFFCNMEGHFMAGMHVEVDVR